MGFYLGIDLGTSGVRFSLIDSELNEIYGAKETFDSQTPSEWWKAILRLFKKTQQQGLSEHIERISFDATSSTVHLLNRSSQAFISESLMYNDDRAKDLAAQYSHVLDKNSGAFGATSTFAKALWLFDNHSHQSDLIIEHQSDWLSRRLSGVIGISDENNALKLGYDPIHRAYPEAILKLMPSALLPKVVPVGTRISSITQELADTFNIPKNTQIIAGTTDSMAAWIASVDQLNTPIGVTSLGSTLAIKIASSVPIFDAKRGVYSHRLNDTWVAGGASNSGGQVLRHYFNDLKIQQLTQNMSDTPTKLKYYPLIQPGERFPYPDPNKQPCLDPRPESDAVFFQAILEGLTQIEVQGYKVLSELGAIRPKMIYTCGGGANNPKWMKYRSELLNCEVKKAPNADAAYGAAKIASGWLNQTTLE